MTREGNLNADALRKLKQVNHLVRLLSPALDDVWSRFGSPVVVDAGSGNAYLGFILYELFFASSEKGSLLSIEAREELTARAKERAERLGFSRMSFSTSSLESAQYPERIHLLVALHACDVATDDALWAAISRNADHVAVVPCCQAEVAAQLKEAGQGARPSLTPLFSHPWHRREMGSHLTNVIRALALEASGYQVTVTELAGWEHSLKNELILGRKVHRENRAAKEKLLALVDEWQVAPKLLRNMGLARGSVESSG